MTAAVIESGYRTSYYVKRRDRSGEHEGDMEGTTHAATGFLAGTGIGLLVHASSHPVGHLAVAHNIGIDLLFGAVGAGLALLPDADHPKASFAYSAGFVSRGLSHLMAVVFGGHRAGMHSLFGMALFSLATEAGAVWFPNLYSLAAVAVVLAMTTGAGLAATGFAKHGLTALFWGAVLAGLAVWAVRGDLWWLVLLGMGLHIAEDMCTGHGVTLLWPFYLKRIGGDGKQPARSRQRKPVVQRPAPAEDDGWQGQDFGPNLPRSAAGRPAPAATAAPTAPFRTGPWKPKGFGAAVAWTQYCGECLDGDHGECTDRGCKCDVRQHPKRPGQPKPPRPPLPDEPPY